MKMNNRGQSDPPILGVILVGPFMLLGGLWLVWHFFVTFLPWWWDLLVAFADTLWHTL